MHKILYIYLICILLPFSSYAQKSHHKKTRHSPKKPLTSQTGGWWVGVNASNLMKNIFAVAPSTQLDPYTLTTRFKLSNTLSGRIGANMGLRRKQSGEDDVASIQRLNGALRLGAQKEIFVYHKFYFYYGGDLAGRYLSDWSSFKGISKTNTSWLIGGGPVIGFGFQLGKRLRLSTESSYYFMIGNERKELDVTGEKTISNQQITNIIHLLPNSLYLSFRL